MKWAIAILALAAACGCGFVGEMGPQTIGSGVSKTDTRKVTSFDTIVLKGSPDLEISIGKGPSVEVTTDDNIIPLITTDVSGNQLVISSKSSYNSKNGVKVKIVTTSLKELNINGSGNANISGLDGDDFEVNVNGSGDVMASGKANKINAEVNGSGDIDLSGVVAKTGDVSVHGSGDVNVNVSDELDASIAGSGDITYAGSPKVNKSVMGSGSVHGGK